MRQPIRSLKAKFYAFSFFDDFVLIYPLYTVMFANVGLTPAKISSLLVIWSLTAFLLEVPAGPIADKFQRRHVLIVAILTRAAGYTCWLFFRNYWGFAIGFLLWGIKSALTSGTEEAIVYDELKRVDQLDSYAKVTGRMQTLNLVAIVLASLGASVLARHGYSLILVASIIAVVISAVAIFLLPKAPKVQDVEEAKYLQYLKEGVLTVLRQPKALYIVSFMSVVAGLGAVDEYFSLFFKEKGFNVSGIAFWSAVIFLFGAVGTYFAHKIEKKKFPLTPSLLCWAALLFVTALAPKVFAPLLLGLYFMFFSVVGVVFNAHLQKELNDKVRATATSLGGLGSELFALAAYGVVGLSASHAGYTFSYKLVAGVVVAAALLLALYNRKAKVVI